MRRGEIRIVDLEPVRGTDKRRPAVLVSNDGANRTAERLGRRVVTIVPITSNTSTIYPFQLLLSPHDTGLDHDSKAQAEQVRSVAVERIGSHVGTVRGPLLAELDEALRLHFDLCAACTAVFGPPTVERYSMTRTTSPEPTA